MTFRALGLLLVAASFSQAPAALADAEAGMKIAEQWCAQCHAITADPTRASDAAPPFAIIADNPAWTDGALRSWLSAPHDPMPDLSLEKAEIESIIDYLNTL